jgi:hypothetical protein
MASRDEEEVKGDRLRMCIQPAPSTLKPRKHWPLNLTVQLPNVEEPMKIETNSQLRVKQLKQLIKEKAQMNVSVERI